MKKKPLHHQILLFVFWFFFLALFISFLFLWSFFDKFAWVIGYLIYTILFALPLALSVFFSKKRTPLSKLSLVFVILGFPFFGVLIYILYARVYSHSFPHKVNVEHRDKYVTDFNKVQQTNLSNLLATLPVDDPKAKLVNFLGKLTSLNWYPLESPKQFKWLFEGCTFFDDLLESIKKAKKSIYIECFTTADSEVLDAILWILDEKLKQGVDVRILIDGAGSFLELPLSLRYKIQKKGIGLGVFFQVIYFMFGNRTNYRNHRKIILIDGEVAFLGGFNLADEYANKSERFGYWRDTNFKVSGLGVSYLNLIHEQDYNFVTHRKIKNLPKPDQILYNNNSDLVMFCDDGPNDTSDIHNNSVAYLCSFAKERIWITTPYLVLSPDLFNILKFKAINGVDVRIIVPSIADKKSVFRITADFCKKLAPWGVKIYKYNYTFIHAKSILIDDEISISGSSNFDIRSFRLSFEVLGFFISKSIAFNLQQQFLKDFAASTMAIPNPSFTFFQFVFSWLWGLLVPFY